MFKIFETILDLILPRPTLVRELEEMTAGRLRALAVPPTLPLPKHTLAIFDYRTPLIRTAIWELKYRGNKKISYLLAECLYEELLSELSDETLFHNFTHPLIIPVPLSDKRLRERGWNQATLLVTALGKHDDTHALEINTQLIRKIRHTESQTTKNRSARLENLAGCFEVTAPEKVHGRNIILIDDVTTTGATFAEISKTLRMSGAHKILCVAVAH